MRKFIFEENSREKSNADKNESEDDPSTMCSPCIENHHFVDLRQSIKDKISRNEIFYSFEIVSVRKPQTFYQRFVQQKKLDPQNYNTINKYMIIRKIIII